MREEPYEYADARYGDDELAVSNARRAVAGYPGIGLRQLRLGTLKCSTCFTRTADRCRLSGGKTIGVCAICRATSPLDRRWARLAEAVRGTR